MNATKRVLLLGAGLVSGPIARYLLELPWCRLTVATLEERDARALVGDHPHARTAPLDVNHGDRLAGLIGDSDLVISLVPFAFHVLVARAAIRHRVPMITTSYVSPEMQALDAEAREAGVLILNESGLDPGIDHMSAMRVIRRARATGGTITGFWSYCGGLPAPGSADNPWRYKFSWSPRGALLAGKLAARYLEDGQVRHIPGEALFRHAHACTIEALGEFEAYPNRDSLRYVRVYDLPHVRDMLRGTLRYPGWCAAMNAVAELGLLDLTERSWRPGATHALFLESFLPPGDGTLAERLCRRLGLPADHDVIRRFEWMGLLSDEPLASREGAPLDVLAGRFQHKLVYGPGERDMVVLKHTFRVERGGAAPETLHSLLLAYGEPGGETATARTVSWPAAISARRILEGKLRLAGVHVPVLPEIYEPVLEELPRLGIELREWSGAAS